MSATSHAKMHRDHTAWRKEDDLWRDELAVWEQDVSQALKELPLVEKALRAQAKKLKQHAAAIRLYEREYLGHEHNVTEYERRQIPLKLVKRARAHGQEAEQHLTRRKAHEELKKQQRSLLAPWKRVSSALFPRGAT